MECCDGCGFVYDLDLAPGAADEIPERVARISTIVGTAENAAVVRRPQPQTWSVLEYACHLRDVLLVQRERVLLALRADKPNVAPRGGDERVDHDGYNKHRPAHVARQLGDAALLFTGVLRRLDDRSWDRTLIYN